MPRPQLTNQMFLCPRTHSGTGNRLFQWAAAAHWAKQLKRTLVYIPELQSPTAHDSQDLVWLRDMLQVKDLPESTALTTVHVWSRESVQAYQGSRANLMVLHGYSFEERWSNDLVPYLQSYIQTVRQKGPLLYSALHVRLGGDYDQSFRGNIFNIFYTNMKDYYQKALTRWPKSKALVVVTPDPKLPSWLLDMLQTLEITYSILPQQGPRDTFETLIRCEGLICSNSTFAWWAARLQGPDTTVYMPDPWARIQEWTLFQEAWSIQPHAMTMERLSRPNWTRIRYSTWNFLWSEVALLSLLGSVVLAFLYHGLGLVTRAGRNMARSVPVVV